MQSNPACTVTCSLGVPLLPLPRLPYPVGGSGAMAEGRSGCWTWCCLPVLSGLCGAVLHPPGLLAFMMRPWLVQPVVHLAPWSCLSSAVSVHTNRHLFHVSACFPFPKAGPQALNSPRPSAFPSGSRIFWVSPGPHSSQGE